MDETTGGIVVFVAVLLENIKGSNVAILEEIVPVACVLSFEVALGEVGHDGVEDVLQTAARPVVFVVCEALGELHIATPVKAGRAVVVFPIHQRPSTVELVALAKGCRRAERQARGFVGVHVDFCNKVGLVVRVVQTRGGACEVVWRQEISIEQSTIDIPRRADVLAEGLGQNLFAGFIGHSVHSTEGRTGVFLVGVVSGEEQPQRRVGALALFVFAPRNGTGDGTLCEVVTKLVQANSGGLCGET